MEKMIADPVAYFQSFVPSRSPILCNMEEEAQKEDIPIVGPVVGELLYILARITQARRILELGTATGYSGIYLAQACLENGGQLTTIEMNPDLAVEARHNFEKAGVAAQVDIRRGESRQVMAAMASAAEQFDFIFMDIDKEFYAPALPLCRQLLNPGGFLLADNAAFNDARDFNQAISSSRHWRSVHLYALLPQHSPEHDALCLALRT